MTLNQETDPKDTSLDPLAAGIQGPANRLAGPDHAGCMPASERYLRVLGIHGVIISLRGCPAAQQRCPASTPAVSSQRNKREPQSLTRTGMPYHGQNRKSR